MAKDLNIQTIRQAQAGNTQSLSAVAEQARQKVYSYIYRLTLDYHLTQDLTQETALEMIKALPKLKVPHVNGFWGWIFRTAVETHPGTKINHGLMVLIQITFGLTQRVLLK